MISEIKQKFPPQKEPPQPSVVEIKQLTEELVRTRAELDQFVNMASHDLQEPLVTVMGYLDLLKIQYKGKLGPEADEFIGFAIESAVRMRSLLHDLVAYSRITSRGAVFKITALDLIYEKAVENLEQAIRDTGAVIQKKTLPAVWCDENQIQLVFQNLISNAIKFHGKKNPLIEISCNVTPDEWVIAIKDNGIGFESQYMSQMFSVFRRLHAQVDYPGNGIGLALCKKILERHHGRIWAESVPEQGSTFFFSLPVTINQPLP